ncbi:MAG: amino acid permease [Candidatus Omnitrophica bacterium]|nr:amino acid permease [Candidatus Omnitrophota bacterium]
MLALKKVERPRELTWFHAGSMLYGDWGTSKAYVLGIAFALIGHASWFFLGLMSVLTAVIGVCYMIVCRIFPDGGGVYSSVKHQSRSLAVVGALLLVADYVITAALSAVDAFHYLGVPHPEIWAIGSIILIGGLNWIGPTKGGGIAVVIAILASLSATILMFFTLPSLPHVNLVWPENNWTLNWTHFTVLVLALSGVEAIANMTGIMKPPVERTSKRAILPVLLEVSILTFLLGLAMNAIPGLTDHTEDMLRAIGNHYVGGWYGQLISIIFGFLLLSATNTAVGALVSIQYSMAKDRELPDMFARLNRYGMPKLALFVAVLVPVLVLILQHDVLHLAALYAIGVVGAITLNLGACATNFKIALKKRERALLFVATAILFLIEITIATQKHQALMFALTVLGVGLTLRFAAKKVIRLPLPEEVLAVNVLTVSEAKEIAPLYQSSSMVALKTLNTYLLEEAALRMKARGENSIYLTYVEESPPAPSGELPTEVEPSTESVELLGKAQKLMEAKGLTAVPIWRLGEDPGKLIADAARELGVTTVMIGTTKRSMLVSMLRGDVLRTLNSHLPSDCHLIISG